MDHRVKSIAIHQPNYVPWLGYFFKIFMADHFVFHDDVIFNSKGFTKRCLIRKEFNGLETQWLGIPVIKNNESKIKDVRIDQESIKIEKHLNKLEYLYHSTPYYDYYYPSIQTILSKYDQFEYLAEFNINTIQELAGLLEINSKFHKSSELNLNLKADEYNLALIKNFDCNLYYSGIGAKEYQDESKFSNENISLIYLDTLKYLDEKNYPQHQGEFLTGLSIIDTILNVGVEGVKEILFSMRQRFNPSQIV